MILLDVKFEFTINGDIKEIADGGNGDPAAV